MSQKPKIYFSFRSPYSWIAILNIKKNYPELFSNSDLIPYWEPDPISLRLLKEKGGDFLYSPMSKEKHLYILQDIKRLATKLNYKLTWPIDINPCWEIPHLAYITAEKYGKNKEFLFAVYSARWEKGQNICSEEVIYQISQELGLDPVIVSSSYKNEDVRQKGSDILMKAYLDGVFGIPFFIHGFEKFWGIDRLDDFIFALTKSSPLNKNSMVNVKEYEFCRYDIDHAGGCG